MRSVLKEVLNNPLQEATNGYRGEVGFGLMGFKSAFGLGLHFSTKPNPAEIWPVTLKRHLRIPFREAMI